MVDTKEKLIRLERDLAGVECTRCGGTGKQVNSVLQMYRRDDRTLVVPCFYCGATGRMLPRGVDD